MSTPCIRALADPVQIRECKESLTRLEKSLSDITRLFNLSGNPARLKILFLLHKEGQMCPCDLSDVLDMTVGGVSQHLRKLKDVGIVHDKKVGQTVFYSINKEKTQIIQPVLMSLSSWAKKELV